MRGFWAGYFAARAAPLGAVGAGPVAAAFFNFHPDMVRTAVPACWAVVVPSELAVRRAQEAAGAIATRCTLAAQAALTGALPSLRTAAGRCDGAGRIMTGANCSLWPVVEAGLALREVPEPQRALAEAWQHCTTLREHRGDGHVAALVTHGLDGLAAHLLAAAVHGVAPEILRDNRGYSESEWEAGARRLVGRGLLEPDGTVSAEGRALHAAVESATDTLAEQPWAGLSDAERSALHGALARCAAEIQASGVFPFPNPMGLPRLPDQVEAAGPTQR